MCVFVLERAIFIGPSTKNLKHWSLPKWKHLFALQVAKLKQMYSPIIDLFSLYTWGLNFEQTIWDKIEMLLGMPLGTTWELGESQGDLLRRCWEHNKNKGEKPPKKKLPILHPQKGKNWAHHEGMLSIPIICQDLKQCWHFTFRNAWITFFYMFIIWYPKGIHWYPKDITKNIKNQKQCINF
jgi:hypothetical protein